jgi:predicted metal-dependent hydrolase
MDKEGYIPLILGFVADLFFVVKIEAAARQLHYQVRWIERAEEIAPPAPDALARQLAEHLVGPGAVLLDLLTQWQPALILIDLGIQEVPWREWLPLIKSVPATRRIPVVCFGSHVDVDTMQAAKNRGADVVLACSRFVTDLAGLIQKHARIPDFDGILSACQDPPSALALKGLEEFNLGRYFEAHELLEEAWNEDESPACELYRAVLQVAVAYLQIERGNYNGAMKMFLRLRQWIDPLPEICRGVDVAQLRADAQQAHAALVALGKERIGEFDQRLFKPVVYQPFES